MFRQTPCDRFDAFDHLAAQVGIGPCGIGSIRPCIGTLTLEGHIVGKPQGNGFDAFGHLAA